VDKPAGRLKGKFSFDAGFHLTASFVQKDIYDKNVLAKTHYFTGIFSPVLFFGVIFK